MGRTFKGLKPYVSKSVGAFQFNFYYKEGKPESCFLRINNEDGIFSMKIAGNTDAYGYLFAAALQDKDEQLHGYAVLLCVPAMAMMKDQQFADDLGKAVNGYIERKQNQGAEEAEKVTDEQEQGNQAIMEDVARFADAESDKERDAMREEWKDEAREVLGESEAEASAQQQK